MERRRSLRVRHPPLAVSTLISLLLTWFLSIAAKAHKADKPVKATKAELKRKAAEAEVDDDGAEEGAPKAPEKKPKKAKKAKKSVAEVKEELSGAED
jgi:hypothetical protein